jgi:hypothetical protein
MTQEPQKHNRDPEDHRIRRTPGAGSGSRSQYGERWRRPNGIPAEDRWKTIFDSTVFVKAAVEAVANDLNVSLNVAMHIFVIMGIDRLREHREHDELTGEGTTRAELLRALDIAMSGPDQDRLPSIYTEHQRAQRAYRAVALERDRAVVEQGRTRSFVTDPESSVQDQEQEQGQEPPS